MQQTLDIAVGIVQYFKKHGTDAQHPVPSSDIITEKLEKPKAFCYT